MSEQDESQKEPQVDQDAPGPGDSGEETTKRPTGTSDAEDYTGVDPQNPIDPASPKLQAGGG